jgi:hypothetical protein
MANPLAAAAPRICACQAPNGPLGRSPVRCRPLDKGARQEAAARSIREAALRTAPMRQTAPPTREREERRAKEGCASQRFQTWLPYTCAEIHPRSRNVAIPKINCPRGDGQASSFSRTADSTPFHHTDQRPWLLEQSWPVLVSAAAQKSERSQVMRSRGGIQESRKDSVSILWPIAGQIWASASAPAIRGGNKNYSCPAPR